jgi:hypothetical protein
MEVRSGAMEEEYESFLVRLWYARQEGERQQGGHAEVEHVQSGLRQRFHSSDTLLAYLQWAARWIQPLNNAGSTPSSQVGSGAPLHVLVHVATEQNSRDACTTIDHPLTNGDPDAVLVVTPRLFLRESAIGMAEAAPIEQVSVGYHTLTERWIITNQSGSSIVAGAIFYMLVLKRYHLIGGRL